MPDGGAEVGVGLALAVIGIPLLIGVIALYQNLLPALFPVETLGRDTVITLWLLYIGLFLSTQNAGFSALFYAYEKAEVPAAIQTISAMLSAVLGVLVESNLPLLTVKGGDRVGPQPGVPGRGLLQHNILFLRAGIHSIRPCTSRIRH